MHTLDHREIEVHVHVSPSWDWNRCIR